MHRRSSSVAPGKSSKHVNRVIRIVAPSVPLRQFPSLRVGGLIGHLLFGVIVRCLDTKHEDGVEWLQTPVGWIDSYDDDCQATVEDTTIGEAEESWRREDDKRKRMASAVASMLVKSHPLPKAKRIVRSILQHTAKLYPEKNILRISKQSIEDIMISLGGKTDLSKPEIFEYIKVAAAQQSNPSEAVVAIVTEINNLMSTRPSLWVVEDLNVLETDDVRRSNDRFVMAAASGDLDTFRARVESGQELTNLHSELRYAALHAAADFGKHEICRYIASTGASLDIRDPRRGQTALHFAAHNGREDVIRVLLDAHADRNIKNNEGKYPYQVADKQGHFECRELLKSIPPAVQNIKMCDCGISMIGVTWDPPKQNLVHHSPILEYNIDCWPVDPDLPRDYVTEKSILTENSNKISEIRMSANGTGDFTEKTPAFVHFVGLIPSKEYNIRVKSRSLAGWSRYCRPVTFSTKPHVPDQPDPVEIIKVSTNGLLLHWHPPLRSNGFPVEFYQLELVEAKKSMATAIADAIEGVNAGASTDAVIDNPAGMIAGRLDGGGSGAGGTKSKMSRRQSAIAEQGGISKFYRLIRHRNLENLFKYLTGLEPFRQYQCRVRAYNQLGFSSWSQYCPPVTPRVAVTVKEYRPQELSATVGWFEPLLSKGRTVERYEVQLCIMRGPMSKNISLLTSGMGHAATATATANTATANTSNPGGAIAVNAQVLAGVGAVDRNVASKRAVKQQGTESEADDDFNFTTDDAQKQQTQKSADPFGWVNEFEHLLDTDAKDKDDLLDDDYYFDEEGNLVESRGYHRNPHLSAASVAASKAGGINGATAAAGKHPLDAVSSMGSQYKPENTGEDTTNEFITVSADVTVGELKLTNLKAGGRYKCRVRAKVKDCPDFFGWDKCVMSDEFQMAPTPPDPPLHVRPALQMTSSDENASHSKESDQQDLTNDAATVVGGDSDGDDKVDAAYHSADSHQVSKSGMVTASRKITEGGQAESSKYKAALLAKIHAHSDYIATDIEASPALSSGASSKDKRGGGMAGGRSVGGSERNTAAINDAPTNDALNFSVASAELYADVEVGREGAQEKADKVEGEGDPALPQWDIMHNSITLTWTNGLSNGLPIDAYRVERAKVRTYRLQDVLRAKEAFLFAEGENDGDDITTAGSEDIAGVAHDGVGGAGRASGADLHLSAGNAIREGERARIREALSLLPLGSNEPIEVVQEQLSKEYTIGSAADVHGNTAVNGDADIDLNMGNLSIAKDPICTPPQSPPYPPQPLSSRTSAEEGGPGIEEDAGPPSTEVPSSNSSTNTGSAGGDIGVGVGATGSTGDDVPIGFKRTAPEVSSSLKDRNSSSTTKLPPSYSSHQGQEDQPKKNNEQKRKVGTSITTEEQALAAMGVMDWIDITELGGTFLGPSRFRAEGLHPGGTYIFRVRQHNALGWSLYSRASRMISTYPSVPPGAPQILTVHSTYVTLRWAEAEAAGAAAARQKLSRQNTIAEARTTPRQHQHQRQRQQDGGKHLNDSRTEGDTADNFIHDDVVGEGEEEEEGEEDSADDASEADMKLTSLEYEVQVARVDEATDFLHPATVPTTTTTINPTTTTAANSFAKAPLPTVAGGGGRGGGGGGAVAVAAVEVEEVDMRPLRVGAPALSIPTSRWKPAQLAKLSAAEAQTLLAQSSATVHQQPSLGDSLHSPFRRLAAGTSSAVVAGSSETIRAGASGMMFSPASTCTVRAVPPSAVRPVGPVVTGPAGVVDAAGFTVVALESGPYVYKVLQQLAAGCCYTVRVRVRTVVGWSPWSPISEPFRTLH